MRLTHFCNRFSTRAPNERSIPEVSDTLARSASRTTEPKPQRTTRVTTQLTLRRQLRMSRTRRARSFRSKSRAPHVPGGSSDRRPLVRRTSVAAFSAVNGERESPSDIPCRRTRPGPRPLLNATRTASPAASSKATAFPAQDAFHRRVLARRRFHGTSGASPPPGPRTLPSRPGFRRFFASRKRKARHRRFRELIARERSAPRAARRLLQSNPFASTTDGSTELQAFGRLLSFRPGGPPSPDPQPPCEGAGPRSHGSEAGVFWRCHAGTLRHDCSLSKALPQPNRLGHLLSRARGLRGWSSHDTFRTRPRAALSRDATPARLSPPRRKGRLTHPPAKESALRCTRGAFHLRTSS
jgi:hypothetical protein